MYREIALIGIVSLLALLPMLQRDEPPAGSIGSTWERFVVIQDLELEAGASWLSDSIAVGSWDTITVNVTTRFGNVGRVEFCSRNHPAETFGPTGASEGFDRLLRSRSTGRQMAIRLSGTTQTATVSVTCLLQRSRGKIIHDPDTEFIPLAEQATILPGEVWDSPPVRVIDPTIDRVVVRTTIHDGETPSILTVGRIFPQEPLSIQSETGVVADIQRVSGTELAIRFDARFSKKPVSLSVSALTYRNWHQTPEDQ